MCVVLLSLFQSLSFFDFRAETRNHALSSLQTYPSMEALSFFQPKLPSSLHWFLSLSTEVGCDHSVQHKLLLCFHSSLHVERLQSLLMAPLLIFNLIASSLLFIHFEIG